MKIAARFKKLICKVKGHKYHQIRLDGDSLVYGYCANNPSPQRVSCIRCGYSGFISLTVTKY